MSEMPPATRLIIDDYNLMSDNLETMADTLLESYNHLYYVLPAQADAVLNTVNQLRKEAREYRRISYDLGLPYYTREYMEAKKGTLAVTHPPMQQHLRDPLTAAIAACL